MTNILIVSCSHGMHLGYSIAKKPNENHAELFFDKFPDDELRIKFNSTVKNKVVVLIQSFYKSISDCVIEVILASRTARELGAKRVILVAPYFPYLRQDKRFRKGEAVSQRIIADLIDKYFDSVYVMDPHLHRRNKLGDIFKIKSKRLTANSLIASYIKKHIKNPVIIGPDEESYKWAKEVAEILRAGSFILNKKRYSSYHVEVKLNKKINLKSYRSEASGELKNSRMRVSEANSLTTDKFLSNKNVVIVDDIISTGHTILETAKVLKKLGAKNIYCICVHGIFVNGALKRLRKAKIKVVSANTIPSKVAKIDVSEVIANELSWL